MPPTNQGKSLLYRRQAPEIGGSVGGFVALVVCLVAVIIFSLTGIVYLWRGEPRSGRRRDQQDAQRSAGFFASTKLAKLLRIGQRRQGSAPGTSVTSPPVTPRSSIKKGSDSLRGWGRANSAEDVYDQTEGLRQLSYSQPTPLSFSSPLFVTPTHSPVPFRPPTARLDSSSSVVRFENPHTVTVYHPILSTSPQPSIPTITTVPSAPSTPPHVPRTLSPELMAYSEEETDERQQFAVHSGMSMQTLKRGTKFVESL